MELANNAVFSPACVALNMAPGPNKLLSISYALRYGLVMACRGGARAFGCFAIAALRDGHAGASDVRPTKR